MQRPEPDWMPRRQRPARLPERLDLREADPAFALAGQRGTWRLPMALAEDLAPQTELRLQLHGGRNNSGGVVGAQADRPADDGYVTVYAPDGTPLALTPAGRDGTFALRVPGTGLSAGTVLTVTLGDRSGGGRGIEATRVRMLNKFFVLFLAHDPTGAVARQTLPSWSVDGTGRGPEPTAESGATWTERNQHLIVAACSMHVLGGPILRLRVYGPSQATPGEPIDLVVRPEDPYSNLSYQSVAEVRVTLDGRDLPAAVEPVPDSTCVRVRVQLDGEAVCRLVVTDRASGCAGTSNPIACASEPVQPRVLWGMIHGHTEMSDGTGTLDAYFHQIRHEAGLDFAAPGDHDHLWETSDAMWQTTCDAVARWHDPGRFVTLLGYEWAKWRKNGDGDRNVYYRDDHRPMYRSDEGCCPAPPDLFAALGDETAMVIPHHTGHAGNFCDWKDHDPTPERLVEIYQIRGSYETSAEAGNPVPEACGAEPIADGYVSRALALGWRVGFTAGGDDHLGHAGTEFPGGHDGYKAGLMAVEADACTRDAIWDALWNRRVVATTGPRLLLTYQLNGRRMGSELAADPDLARCRRLDITYHGTADVDRIDIIRNNDVVHTTRGSGLDHHVTWDDTTPLDEVLLAPVRFCPNRFCFYYVRVTQADREVAWASPVWIDG